MRTKRDIARRPELLYRDMNESQEINPRLVAIIEKALDFMERTEPEEWTKVQWTLLNKIWTESKLQKKATNPTSKMSSDDLRNSLLGSLSNLKS